MGDHATNMPATVWFGGNKTITYTYDAYNRLTKEVNDVYGITYDYTYDEYGNRTSMVKTWTDGDSETTTYSYNAKGQLISVNGSTVSYNENGCPVNYLGRTLTWERGNLLKTCGGTTFTYDGTGRRIKVNGLEFYYDSQGNLVKTSDGKEYYYDHTGIMGFKYNGNNYVYQKDIQGNIVAIIDSNGNTVVKYNYDAWGNCLITGDSALSNANPFRYRGYYYDTQTGLYYLQTRYYDPTTGRFISPDNIDYANPETVDGLNLYAYCGNNPVMYVDPTGEFFGSILIASIIIGTVFGAVSGGISAAQNGEEIWKGMLIGGLKGLVTGAAFGLGGAIGAAVFVAGSTISLGAMIAWTAGVAVVTFAAGIGINYVESQIYNKPFSWDNAVSYAGILAVESVLSFGTGLLLGSKGYWPQNSIKYKGVINKIIGTVTFMASNIKIIIERTYLKNALLFPINFILNSIWKIKNLSPQNN